PQDQCTDVAGNLLPLKMAWIVPSAVSEAIARSRLLRKNASFASIAGPTSAVDAGSGAGALTRSPAKAWSLACSVQSEGAQTSAAPVVPRKTARSAAASSDIGKRLQRSFGASACRYWIRRRSALVPI